MCSSWLHTESSRWCYIVNRGQQTIRPERHCDSKRSLLSFREEKCTQHTVVGVGLGPGGGGGPDQTMSMGQTVNSRQSDSIILIISCVRFLTGNKTAMSWQRHMVALVHSKSSYWDNHSTNEMIL